MKKIALILSVLAAATAVSCSKTQPAELSEGIKSLSATIPADIAKTAIGDPVQGGYEIIWKEGDAIAANGAVSKALTAAGAGSARAVFTFGEDVSAPYDVISPAEALLSNGKVTIPCAQTWSAGQFDPKAAILAGHSETDEITLANASAFVKVSIKQAASEKLKEIKLYSYAGEAMSGTFAINYGTAALTATSDTLNYVTVSAEEGIEYNATGYATAVFAIPAGEYSKGFAISAATVDGIQMGKLAYSTTGITLAGGDILAMPEITFAGGASLYSGGSGTQSDPYRIATAKDLVTLSEQNAAAKQTAYFKQVADIDMSGVAKFTPIGSSSYYFAGVYDGGGRFIDNLTIDTALENTGLFGYMRASGAKICNVNLRNANITSSASNTAAICGFGYQGDVENCTLTNCHLTTTGANGAGLVCGRPYIFNMTGCKADIKCTVSGTADVGGLIGGGTTYATGKNLVIKDCDYLGSVTGSGNYVGGIIGGGTVMKGTSTVTVKNCNTIGNVTGGAYTGGIIGGVDPSSDSNLNTARILLVEGCTASGNIKGKYGVGGIAGGWYGGSGSAVIMNCAYIGEEIESTTVNGSDGYNAVGGILGWNRTNKAVLYLANCYSLVKRIKFATGSGTPKSYGAGGILGYTSVATGYTGTCEIRGCYSTVELSSFSFDGAPIKASQTGFGGIYGSFSSTLSAGHVIISDCWYSSADVKGDTRYAVTSNTSAVYSDPASLLTNLNKFAATFTHDGISCQSWKSGAQGFPVFSSSSQQEEETEGATLSGGTEKEGQAGSDGGNFENNDIKDPLEW